MGKSERRQYERHNFQKEMIIQAVNPMSKQSIEFYAKTINISRGGILAYTIADFKENTKCVAKFKSNKYSLIERKGTVLRIVEHDRPAHLRESEKMYALEFDDAFTETQLLAILDKIGDNLPAAR